MFKKFIKIQISALVILLTLLVGVNFVSAASLLKDEIKNKIGGNARSLGDQAGYAATANDDAALYLVQTVINVFLSVIGVLLLSYILFAGYNWLTAQGEEEKVTKAKDTIKRAIIGAIIIIAAYAISVFVMSRMEAGVLKGGGGSVKGIPSTP